MDYSLLRTICQIGAPSGDESDLSNFILNYIRVNSRDWRVQPEILYGDEFQDCILLKFGEPRTAIFAHMDSVGFSAAYNNELVKIGSPAAKTGQRIVGKDVFGEINCKIDVQDGMITHDFPRGIQRGTSLTYEVDFKELEDSIQSASMDNRVGVFSALKVAETLQNGVIAFSCWEEVGGGSVPYLIKNIYEKWHIKQVLIADVTWVTEGVHHGQGVAISLRDHSIPRQSFVRRVIEIAMKTEINYQLEVESSGSSDGREIHESPYPIDWCFIGAPEDLVHSPEELVYKHDIEEMIRLYKALMIEL